MFLPPDQIAILQQLLERPRRVVVVSHYNPDGDALGSALGLMHLLRAAGHHAKVVLPNTPGDFLDWLPGRGEVLCLDRSPDAALSTIRTCDLVICADFNRLDRIGDGSGRVGAWRRNDRWGGRGLLIHRLRAGDRGLLMWKGAALLLDRCILLHLHHR